LCNEAHFTIPCEEELGPLPEAAELNEFGNCRHGLTRHSRTQRLSHVPERDLIELAGLEVQGSLSHVRFAPPLREGEYAVLLKVSLEFGPQAGKYYSSVASHVVAAG
jgi:hypothetical protein